MHKMHERVPAAPMAPKILRLLLLASVLLVALHVGLKYVSVVVYSEQHVAAFELSNRFDMNDENSVPQWMTLVSFLLLTSGSFVAAYLARKPTVRRLWLAIGILALLLSIDDAAAIHESLLGLIHISAFKDSPATLLRNAWLFFVPLVLIIGGWLLAYAVRLLPQRTVLYLLAGGVVFLMGALGMDSLANTVAERSFTGQGIIAGIEGWLQLIGLALLVYAVADYLERQHGKALHAAFGHLKSSD